jgi:hypothetical protein
MMKLRTKTDSYPPGRTQANIWNEALSGLTCITPHVGGSLTFKNLTLSGTEPATDQSHLIIPSFEY